MITTSAIILIVLNTIALSLLFRQTSVIVYQPSPRAYLASICQQPDCDFDLLDSIAWCESKWKMVQNSISSAYGYFQIIDGTEATTPQYQEGKSKYNAYDNVDMGVFLYQRDGINPWLESRACWHWRYQGAVLQEPPICLGLGCDG